jgi:hypothetical protein
MEPRNSSSTSTNKLARRPTGFVLLGVAPRRVLASYLGPRCSDSLPVTFCSRTISCFSTVFSLQCKFDHSNVMRAAKCACMSSCPSSTDSGKQMCGQLLGDAFCNLPPHDPSQANSPYEATRYFPSYQTLPNFTRAVRPPALSILIFTLRLPLPSISAHPHVRAFLRHMLHYLLRNCMADGHWVATRCDWTRRCPPLANAPVLLALRLPRSRFDRGVP